MAVGELVAFGFNVSDKAISTIKARRLPAWGWVLATLFYPVGPFIALASARLLAWPAAVFLAVAAYALAAGTAFSMSRLGEESLAQTAMLVGATIVFVGIGVLQFWLGARASYWSSLAKRLWIIFGCLGALAILGSAIVLIFKLI